MTYYLVLKNNLGESGYAYLGESNNVMITPEINEAVLNYKFQSAEDVHKKAIELEVPAKYYMFITDTEMLERFTQQCKSKEKRTWVVCYINRTTKQKNYLKIRITPTGKKEIYYEPGIVSAALFDKEQAIQHGQNITKMSGIDKEITNVQIERIL